MALSDGCGEGWPCTSRLLTQHRFELECFIIFQTKWCLLRCTALRLSSLQSLSLSVVSGRWWRASPASDRHTQVSWLGGPCRWREMYWTIVLRVWVLTCPERLAEVGRARVTCAVSYGDRPRNSNAQGRLNMRAELYTMARIPASQLPQMC